MKDEDEKAAFRDQQDHLKTLIHQSIAPCKDDPEKTLHEQARLLDLAFRRFMGHGVHHGYSADFSIGFKAQNQYRHTVKLLKSMKENEKHGNHQQKP